MADPNESLLGPLPGETAESVETDLAEARNKPGAEEPLLDAVDSDLLVGEDARADDADDPVARMREAGGDGTASAFGA